MNIFLFNYFNKEESDDKFYSAIAVDDKLMFNNEILPTEFNDRLDLSLKLIEVR